MLFLEHLQSGLIGRDLGVEVAEGDLLSSSKHRGDDGIVGEAKTSQYEGHHDTISLSLTVFPTAMSSSASPFVLLKYVDAGMLPFLRLAICIWMFAILDWDYTENMFSSVAQTSAAVVMIAT